MCIKHNEVNQTVNLSSAVIPSNPETAGSIDLVVLKLTVNYL